SSASTKLLHGGLRYLEQGHIKLVKQALHERRWWMMRAPHLAKTLEIRLPVYKESRRPGWMVWCGLTLYDQLAGRDSLGRSHWLSREEALRSSPDLRAHGLLGTYVFYDGYMDDRALGLWAAERAAEAGVNIHIGTRVDSIAPDGAVRIDGR